MKTLIILVVGLLAVGCGQSDIERLEEESKRLKAQLENTEVEIAKLKADLAVALATRETDLFSPYWLSNLEYKLPIDANATDDNSTKAKPIKELTIEEKKALRDSILGEYEVGKYEDYGDTHKYVLLENGILEWYVNDKKTRELEWKIVKEEIHVKYDSGWIDVYRINQDKSITLIGKIKDGKREDYPKEEQEAWRKIK